MKLKFSGPAAALVALSFAIGHNVAQSEKKLNDQTIANLFHGNAW